MCMESMQLWDSVHVLRACALWDRLPFCVGKLRHAHPGATLRACVCRLPPRAAQCCAACA